MLDAKWNEPEMVEALEELEEATRPRVRFDANATYEYRVGEELPEEIAGLRVVGWMAGIDDGWLYPKFEDWLVDGPSYCYDPECASDVHVAAGVFRGVVKFWRFCETCSSEQEEGVRS